MLLRSIFLKILAAFFLLSTEFLAPRPLLAQKDSAGNVLDPPSVDDLEAVEDIAVRLNDLLQPGAVFDFFDKELAKLNEIVSSGGVLTEQQRQYYDALVAAIKARDLFVEVRDNLHAEGSTPELGDSDEEQGEVVLDPGPLTSDVEARLRKIIGEDLISNRSKKSPGDLLSEVNAIQDEETIHHLFIRVRSENGITHIFIGKPSDNNSTVFSDDTTSTPRERIDLQGRVLAELFGPRFKNYLKKQILKWSNNQIFVHVIDEQAKEVSTFLVPAGLKQKVKAYPGAFLRKTDRSDKIIGSINAFLFCGLNALFLYAANAIGGQQTPDEIIWLKSFHSLGFTLFKETKNRSFRGWEGLNKHTELFKRIGFSLTATFVYLVAKHIIIYFLPYLDDGNRSLGSEVLLGFTNVGIAQLARSPSQRLFYMLVDLRLFDGGWALKISKLAPVFLKREYLWSQIFYLPFFLTSSLDLVATSGVLLTFEDWGVPAMEWVQVKDLGGYRWNYLSSGRLLSFALFGTFLVAGKNISKILYRRAVEAYQVNRSEENRLKVEKYKHFLKGASTSAETSQRTLVSRLNPRSWCRSFFGKQSL